MTTSKRRHLLKITTGISPSGKAPGFDLGIQRFKSSYPSHIFAEVAELVDALDLGSSIFGCESSSLSFRTILYLGKEIKSPAYAGFFIFIRAAT